MLTAQHIAAQCGGRHRVLLLWLAEFSLNSHLFVMDRLCLKPQLERVYGWGVCR